MNSITCGECAYYNEQKKPLKRKDGGSISLKKGHCLKKTVYASNKPDKPVYPPKAIVKELPNGRHQICLVRDTQVEQNCLHAKRR